MDYLFIEPNYNYHESDSGEEVANDQHPDHNIQAGELFIASVYNAIKTSPLWPNTALLVVYDEHGKLTIMSHLHPALPTSKRPRQTTREPGSRLRLIGWEYEYRRS